MINSPSQVRTMTPEQIKAAVDSAADALHKKLLARRLGLLK